MKISDIAKRNQNTAINIWNELYSNSTHFTNSKTNFTNEFFLTIHLGFKTIFENDARMQI